MSTTTVASSVHLLSQRLQTMQRVTTNAYGTSPEIHIPGTKAILLRRRYFHDPCSRITLVKEPVSYYATSTIRVVLLLERKLNPTSGTVLVLLVPLVVLVCIPGRQRDKFTPDLLIIEDT